MRELCSADGASGDGGESGFCCSAEDSADLAALLTVCASVESGWEGDKKMVDVLP